MIDPEVAVQLESLAAMITELRAELERVRLPKRFTMRETGRCPSCRGNRLLHIPEVMETAGSGPVAFAIAHREYNSVTAWYSHERFGHLEAYVCRSCRLVEWHVRDPEGIPVDPRQRDRVATEYGAADPAEGEEPYR
jgi:hypothetical protein